VGTTNPPDGGGTAARLLGQAIPATAADTPGTWIEHATCASTDPEIFFPAKGDPGTQARQVCGRCPVSDDCLAYALASGEESGIWGGLDPGERKNLRRTLQRRRSREQAGKKGAA
jgi:WhiB family transcriptional regulator, redox-sensing transcriptional regulator